MDYKTSSGFRHNFESEDGDKSEGRRNKELLLNS